MQSHTRTASGSLSFRCDSVLPRSMPGAGPLPALISLGRYMPTKRRRYMPTSFRLVRPRTIVLGEVCPDTISRFVRVILAQGPY